ncbi:hypothetical protein PDE_05950 [Penicillium oxalicum 114-2]|uniref:Uncharacterized protein n=1 Tax=Penicillium oxalicum (strain 114-2 / CGMCC 5302) TaxID=933388 RepID=S7ZQR1_PENO1|nr:hypothetical protein PDE_05950 [Penicillium oxalicum 114-2]
MTEPKKRRRRTHWRAAKQPRHRVTSGIIENASWIAPEEHRFHKPYTRYGPVNPPITDPTQIPRDWDGTDNDLDEKDIDKVIQRCKERIEDGVMPHIWEEKLKRYKKLREQEDEAVASENPAMSRNTVIRVKYLEMIRERLGKTKDSHRQAVNVNALIDAYRDGNLTWMEGMVTYWSSGRCIHGPVEFDESWKDTKRLNERCGGESFWVEGLNGPGTLPQLQYNYPAWKSTIQPIAPNDHHHNINFYLRVPGRSNNPNSSWNLANPQSTINRPFMYDTGSTLPMIFTDDFALMTLADNGRWPPFVALVIVVDCNGGLTLDATYLIEYNIRTSNPYQPGTNLFVRPPNEWIARQTIVKDTAFNPATDHRLSGMWVASVLYTGTAPDNSGRLFLAETVTALRKTLPKANVRRAIPQPLRKTAIR